MLRYRLIFGPLMIVLLVALFYLDNRLDRVRIEGTWLQDLFLGREALPAGLLLLLIMFVLIPLLTRELNGIFRAKGIEASYLMITFSAMIGCGMIYILPAQLESQTTLAIYATMMVLVFLGTLIRHSYWQQRTQGAIVAASVTMFALIYLGVLPGFFLAIRRWHTAWVIAAIIVITKFCDIGAYFTGRLIGRHKLIPWLSPGKTWEGLVGGVLLAGLAAMAMFALAQVMGVNQQWYRMGEARVSIDLNPPLWLVFIGGLIIGVVGQVGDLTVSLFKRDAGIKDSGQTIPGFGGFLDVVDSPVLVAPLAYWMLVLAGDMARAGAFDE